MAFNQWIEGEALATGSLAMYRIADMLLDAGWTDDADSDGTTYDSNGGQVTGGGSGTNGLGNTSAWMRLADPAGTRELCIQRGSSDVLWRLVYSAAAGLTGGTPGATRIPTATDDETVLGGGTDASPTYTTLLGTNASYKVFGGADSVAPYAWWAAGIPNGGGTPSWAIFWDPVTSASASDQDALVIYVGINATNVLTSTSIGNNTTSTTTSRAAAWLKYNDSGSFVAMPGNYLSSASGGNVLPGAGGSNPHDGKDDLVPLIWWRNSAQVSPYGRKGISRFVYWNPVTRTAGETFTVDTARDRISIGDINLPWSGSVVTL